MLYTFRKATTYKSLQNFWFWETFEKVLKFPFVIDTKDLLNSLKLDGITLRSLLQGVIPGQLTNQFSDYVLRRFMVLGLVINGSSQMDICYAYMWKDYAIHCFL